MIETGKSIRETFRNRSTTYSPGHSLFAPDFAVDETRQRQWKAFLKRNLLEASLDFSTVMNEINRILFPIWERMSPKP